MHGKAAEAAAKNTTDDQEVECWLSMWAKHLLTSLPTHTNTPAHQHTNTSTPAPAHQHQHTSTPAPSSAVNYANFIIYRNARGELVDGLSL